MITFLAVSNKQDPRVSIIVSCERGSPFGRHGTIIAISPPHSTSCALAFRKHSNVLGILSRIRLKNFGVKHLSSGSSLYSKQESFCPTPHLVLEKEIARHRKRKQSEWRPQEISENEMNPARLLHNISSLEGGMRRVC